MATPRVVLLFLLAFGPMACSNSSGPTATPPSLLSVEELTVISTTAATGRLAGVPATEAELFRRISAGDARSVQLILRAGVSPDSKNSTGDSALTHAVRENSPDAVTALLMAGADVNAGGDNAPIFIAAELNREECALRLATFNGADFRGMARLPSGHLRGNTSGINRSARDSDGRTALFAAAGLGHTGIAQILLESEWDPGVTDKEGTTPMDRALRQAHGAVVRRLIEYGAPLDRRDREGWTPLMRACAMGATISTIEMMLDAGASMDVRDGQGRTALDLAILNKRESIVDLLHRRGGRSGGNPS